MDKQQNKPPGGAAQDEELIDTLIAVSVVAKRLAEKLRNHWKREMPSAAPAVSGGTEGRVNGGNHHE